MTNKLEYKWEQTFDYVTVIINLEPEIKNKDINIDFKSKYLKVLIKEKILEGELDKTIYESDSSWYIDDDGKNKLLMLELSKVIISDEFMWEKLFIDDNQDIRRCEVNLSEFSDKKQMEYIKKFRN